MFARMVLCSHNGGVEESETIDIRKAGLHIFPPERPLAYRYKGDFNSQGQRHGQGTMTWSEEGALCPSMRDLSSYSGQWEAGMAHGLGTFTHSDGVTYEGQWLDGKAHGRGTYSRPAPVTKPLQVGARVTAWHAAGGSSRDSKIRRPAQVKAVRNNTYVLSWDDGNTEDLLKTAADMTLEDKVMEYEGEWVADRQEGKGKETSLDIKTGKQSHYQGEYRDGKKHGQGKVEWANGDTYEGQFKQDKCHGSGRYVWQDGRSYKGGWVDNERMGFGTFNWPNGALYEGEYLNNKRYGQGRYVYPGDDEREYNGEWHDGQQQGNGKYKTFLGAVRQGQFEHNHHTMWTDGNEENNDRPVEEVPPVQV